MNSANFANDDTELSWSDWLGEYFASVGSDGAAKEYTRLWHWFACLEEGVKPEAKGARRALYVRGDFASPTVEQGVAFCGARRTRRLALYICETQKKADAHIDNLATLFAETGIERAVDNYANGTGWRHSQLRTDDGFTVTGIGIKAASRGAGLGRYRPDLIVLDAIDEEGDTQRETQKKIQTLMQRLLPSASPDCAVLFISSQRHKTTSNRAVRPAAS